MRVPHPPARPVDGIDQPGPAIVEGVGAGQRVLSRLVDATVWVQCDVLDAERRGIARDTANGADKADAVAFWHEWTAEELPFLAAERPWERACAVVAGSSPIALAPDQLALASAS